MTTAAAPGGSALLGCFSPVAQLARAFGYFPLLDFRPTSASFGRQRLRVRAEVVVTALSLVLASYNNVRYYRRWPSYFVNDVRDTVQNIFFVSYRFAAQLVLLHFALLRPRQLLALFQRLQRQPPVPPSDVTTLRRLGWGLSVLGLANCLGYTLSVDSYYSRPQDDYASAWDRLSCNYTVLCIIFAYSFVGSFVIFFNCYFLCHFRRVNGALGEGRLWSAAALLRVRGEHERALECVAEYVRVLDGVLSLYIGAEAVACCVNTYELCRLLSRPDHLLGNCSFLLKTVYYIVIRVVPIALLCVTSTRLANQARDGVSVLERSPQLQLSHNTQFELLMLLEHLQHNKPLIKAGHVLLLNNRLLFKITGIIITYIIFMMEIVESN